MLSVSDNSKLPSDVNEVEVEIILLRELAYGAVEVSNTNNHYTLFAVQSSRATVLQQIWARTIRLIDRQLSLLSHCIRIPNELWAASKWLEPKLAS